MRYFPGCCITFNREFRPHPSLNDSQERPTETRRGRRQKTKVPRQAIQYFFRDDQLSGLSARDPPKGLRLDISDGFIKLASPVRSALGEQKPSVQVSPEGAKSSQHRSLELWIERASGSCGLCRKRCWLTVNLFPLSRLVARSFGVGKCRPTRMSCVVQAISTFQLGCTDLVPDSTTPSLLTSPQSTEVIVAIAY